MLFDSHTHLNFRGFKEDRDEVIQRCKDANMLVMNVGAALETSELGVQLSKEHDFCYASVGLHPIHVFDEEFDVEKNQKLVETPGAKVHAVGETGIDFWHIKRTDLPMDEIKKKQRDVFNEHIDLAVQNDLAVIIHGRNGKEDLTAYKEIYEIVKNRGVQRAVVHCYGGDLEEAKMFASLGFKIGITGIITFDKTGTLDEIVQALPIETFLIETDAPYLTPVPHRGERNEPVYVRFVAEHIAKLLHRDVEQIIAITGQNAKELFRIE